MSQSLEQFIDRCMCFIVNHVTFNWTTAAIHNFITIRALGKQLQSFCNNTGVWILASLTTSIDSRSHKVKTFHRSVLNEAIKFCAYESQLQVQKSNGVLIVTLVSSKIEFVAVGSITLPSHHTPASMVQYLVYKRLYFWKLAGNLQKFWHFDITLYVTKQCAWFYLVQQLVLMQWPLVWEWFPQVCLYLNSVL